MNEELTQEEKKAIWSAGWLAFDKHEWPYNLSEDDAKLIKTAIAKNREARS